MLPHPLVNSPKELGNDELRKRIHDITRKYHMTKNKLLREQMSVLLDMYVEEEQSRLQKQVLDTSVFDEIISIN